MTYVDRGEKPTTLTEVEQEFDESHDWTFIRVCRSCGSILGTVRCVLALKKCPECGVPSLPVENHTRSVAVAFIPGWGRAAQR